MPLSNLNVSVGSEGDCYGKQMWNLIGLVFLATADLVYPRPAAVPAPKMPTVMLTCQVT